MTRCVHRAADRTGELELVIKQFRSPGLISRVLLLPSSAGLDLGREDWLTVWTVGPACVGWSPESLAL